MPKAMLALIPLVFGWPAAAQSPMAATDVTAADVQAFVKALPRDSVNDKPIRVVDAGGYKVGIYGVFRPKSSRQDAILHETKVAEVYQILEGSGTLVTGGTLVDPQRADNLASFGFPSVRGPRIEGGVSRHVSKGDMIIIPGRVPHWFSTLDGDITYLIVRPDPEGVLPLK